MDSSLMQSNQLGRKEGGNSPVVDVKITRKIVTTQGLNLLCPGTISNLPLQWLELAQI